MGEEVKAKNEKRRTRAYTRARWERFSRMESSLKVYGLGDGDESIPFCFIVDNWGDENGLWE